MTEPSTEGVDPLDAALAAAENLADAPLAVHAETFERVHELLHSRLQDADGSDAGR